MVHAYKELAPVLYGDNGIKLNQFTFRANEMCFLAHWHNRIELLLLTSGSLEVHLDNEHFTALPGEAVVIMPSTVHCGFSGESGVSYYVIEIDIEKFRNETTASGRYLTPILEQIVTFEALIRHPEIISSMRELVDSLPKESSHNSLYAIGKVYEMISLLYEHCMICSSQPKDLDERFGKVLEYINSHYTENISAKDISKKYGYDKTYFCRRFKEATGITTTSYIRILRLELAQKLLRETKENISNISWKCGYADTHYFSNCFKRHFGVTPTEFRQTNIIVTAIKM